MNMIPVVYLLLLSLTTVLLQAQHNDSIPTPEGSLILVTERIAEFPGGILLMKKFIHKELKHATDTKDCNGKIFFSFTIEVDGTLTKSKIIKGLSQYCGEIVTEIISKMPIPLH